MSFATPGMLTKMSKRRDSWRVCLDPSQDLGVELRDLPPNLPQPVRALARPS
jgi:hypothetical protein